MDLIIGPDEEQNKISEDRESNGRRVSGRRRIWEERKTRIRPKAKNWGSTLAESLGGGTPLKAQR